MNDLKSECKIAVIGCGHWGKNHVRNFSELKALSAINDANSKHAQEMAEQYGVRSLTIDQICADANIHGVVIVTPAISHAETAKKCLLANKHVFIEKPLALKIEDATELISISHKNKLILMVGHLLQYHPAFIKLKELVHSGKLGKLKYVYSNRLSFGMIRSEENVLWSFAPHDISMILSLVKEMPQEVYTSGQAYLQSKIADTAITHLSFPSGVAAHIFTSWIHPYKEHKLAAIGDNGMAVFDDTKPWERKLCIYPHQIEWHNNIPYANKAEEQPIFIEETEPLAAECRHFFECIQNNCHPLTDGQEGLNVLKVLTAAEQSMKSMSSDTNYYVHETAYIDKGCEVGNGTKIWHFSHLSEGAKVGENCIIGQNVFVAPGVVVGNRCKIQNNVSLYKGVILEDGVFCGPSCVFTNVNTPRAEIERKDAYLPTYVERAVTIGANATIVCGTRLGAYSFIAAGAVVTKDVIPHALMAGVPARRIGWVSHSGERLGSDLVCPREGRSYQETKDGNLEEIPSSPKYAAVV